MPVKPDSYVDLLDDLRQYNDASYVLRSKTFPQYRGAYALPEGRSPSQVMEDTLKSSRVKATIDLVSTERGWSKQATEKAARDIATEMAQCFDMKTVRSLAYVAKKVIPRLFTNVYVNRGRFMELKELSERSAIIFMPSHRTYMDFILLQFLCFHYEINLPAIASAIDFLNMKFMGEALRRCGAFFIRRKFGDDKLYWAIFTEYVENQLKHADRPLEFFIEGTRSRTGKSLHPKYGLLSVLLEPYFRNEIFDFYLVPISVSFSRYLEENLYAYELLGFPKPKESTSGLWKARSVLEMDFGDVYVHAAEPISVREYFTKLERPLSIDRSVHALKPLFLFDYTPEEEHEIRRLGHVVVKTNERYAIVRVWSLVCMALSKILRSNSVVTLEKVLEKTGRLFDLTLRLQYHIPLKTGSFKEEVKYSLKLHSNIIDWSSDDRLTLKPVAVSVISTTTRVVSGKVIDAAVSRLIVSNYANQAMHLYADLSFVGLSILKNGDRSDRRAVFNDFVFLQNFFGRDFISVPDDESKSFNESVYRLVNVGFLDSESIKWSVSINDTKSEEIYGKIYELASIVEIFLRGYFFCCDVASKFDDGLVDEKRFVVEVQKSIGEMLEKGEMWNYEMLSGDLIKNCLHSLVVFKAVKKIHDGSVTKYEISVSDVNAIKSKLGSFLAALEAGGEFNVRKSKL